MSKLVCFTGIEAPGVTQHVDASRGVPEHNVYRAVIDGALVDVKVLRLHDLHGNTGWATWPGVFECDFDGEGYVTAMRVAEKLITGYGVYAPTDGVIRLGLRADEYKFAADAPAWMFAKASVRSDFAHRVADLEYGWDDYFFARLDDDGVIREMWVSHEPSFGDSAILEQIRKFDSAWGPEDAGGLAVEYNYYEPKTVGDTKYPVFVWLHGLHGGTNAWTNHFEFNPISNFARDDFQTQFGGAYIITPRANEDLREGHGFSWNPRHVEPFFLMLEDFLAKHPNADRDRVTVGGYSMGGYMTFLLIAAHPETFAGAAPMCGMYALTDEELTRAATLPVLYVCGEGDQNLDNVRNTMRPYLDGNADSGLIVLPHEYLFPDGVTKTPVDHLVWIPALADFKYDDGTRYRDLGGDEIPSLIDWLRARRR
ncbi:MAG: prolyl oligopeptidase family serine peptidase [Oscillospiraceae bacterium]|jgi:predicted esterase|nr:prolyl oligopeptidase family serine peptidase [Oscillospiraceae bacterium]